MQKINNIIKQQILAGHLGGYQNNDKFLDKEKSSDSNDSGDAEFNR